MMSRARLTFPVPKNRMMTRPGSGSSLSGRCSTAIGTGPPAFEPRPLVPAASDPRPVASSHSTGRGDAEPDSSRL